MAHRLDVVAIGTAHERADLPRVVLRPLPWSVEHGRAGDDRSVEEPSGWLSTMHAGDELVAEGCVPAG